MKKHWRLRIYKPHESSRGRVVKQNNGKQNNKFMGCTETFLNTGRHTIESFKIVFKRHTRCLSWTRWPIILIENPVHVTHLIGLYVISALIAAFGKVRLLSFSKGHNKRICSGLSHLYVDYINKSLGICIYIYVKHMRKDHIFMTYCILEHRAVLFFLFHIYIDIICIYIKDCR